MSGDLAALPRAFWNSSLLHCTHHSRVASAHSPRDVTELSMNTKGTLDHELFMEGGDTSHTQTPDQGMMPPTRGGSDGPSPTFTERPCPKCYWGR